MNKKMQIFSLIVFVFILGFSIFCNLRPTDITDIVNLPIKTFTAHENFISLEGTWLPQDERENNFFKQMAVNISSIHCDKKLLTCSESRAILPKLRSSSHMYDFFIYNFDYVVTQWTDNYLKAEDVGAGRIFVLTIDFQNKTAVLNVTDNQENATASSESYTAILGK